MNIGLGETANVAGFLLVILAAVMNGAYAIPMRFMSRWKWENIWLAWTVLSLWALPMALAVAIIPHPLAAYSCTPWASLIRLGFIGLLWGTGVLLMGRSYPFIGVAVGTSVGLGCASAVGTLLPVFFAGMSFLTTSKGERVLVGVSIVLFGVSVCGFAGRARERRQGTCVVTAGRSIHGFILASVGGAMTGVLNLALAAGTAISATLEQQHLSTSVASVAVWVPVLLTGGIPGVLYTCFLLSKNHSAADFPNKASTYWPLIILMSLLWLGSIVTYGDGVTMIGPVGPVVGWPVFMAGAVIAAALWGALFGEWKKSGKTAKVAMTAGVFCLMAAVAILGKTTH